MLDRAGFGREYFNVVFGANNGVVKVFRFRLEN